ncbi:FecCD family ABC transporter permease [Pimelobacter simplex]|uniref:FecCD family ABC transporter permease n=1 Tax=Nocardioides simplex TaxID=2045 RepID=UPI00214F7DFA|nr:iron chelate uptake ABC transporter family permease subunit [Pimelobacter simplex]UUW89860.1 iron chelate uptake ABC transporter family permease subunit [Pimelobacter simplex]UUW93689.1 iron chelate uptake ABC transporter family permease subunit [Pimelobacter simplex]
MTLRHPGPLVALVALGAALFGAVVWSLSIGKGDLPSGSVLPALFRYDDHDAAHIIVRQVRLPRTLLAILVGAALALAGALVQALTRNPLAEPGVLGVTFGASFAVVVATALGVAAGQGAQMVVATLGAALATAVVYAVGRADPLRLLLAGTAFSALVASLSLGIRLLDPDAFDDHRFWAVGSLAGRDQQPLTLPTIVVLVAVVVALVLVRPLSALEMGDDVAHGLGVRVGATRTGVLVVATVLAGVATAIAGPIAFAGLIVPHLVRRFARGSVGWLIVLSLAGGPVLLVAADTIGRLVLPVGDAPVAIVTGVLGGPLLAWVVRRQGAEAAS